MRALIFDTETTGLITNSLIPLARQPRVIEFFGLTIEDGEIGATYNALIKVDERLPSEIIRITGITDEMLENELHFDAIAPQINEFIEQHDLCVAHNLAFDARMIDMEFARLDKVVEWPRKLCTVEATQWIEGYRLNLTALHTKLFGEPFKGAHRAETDVRALARCYLELVHREMI